ncbi:MAG: hypothetical protein DRJ01_14435 [Bacteroidetes bacterium]|nr:MAG: hypothetical protein DRJ01_14435 [Bacteroidota bacterium]
MALANQDLVASITPNINYAFEGQVITFTASAQGSEGTLSFLWSGGGTSSTKTYTIPSLNESPYEITCTVTDNNTSDPATINITIFEDFDMDIDADYDGNIDDDDDDIEESSGGIVSVNQDDDNDNNTLDKNESGTVSGENDLEKIELAISPMPNAGNVVLTAITGGSKIKIWENANKVTQIILPKTWNLENDTIPDSIYVEGVAGSSSQRDIELQLCYENSSILRDKIKITSIKVDIDKIAFNYDPASHSHDGLNIRENYSTAISIPEYVKNVQNKPVAYIKNESVKMLVRIKIEPSSFSTIKIKGISDDSDGSLGNITEKEVTFSNGISQEGSDNSSTSGIDESEYIEFSVGNTPNKVFVSVDNWKWVVTKLDNTTIPDMDVDKTTGHKIYTVFAEPHSPWVTSSGSNKNPWTNVLEYACTWAKNATDESSAISLITSNAYTDFGREYKGGDSHTDYFYTYCRLTELLSHNWVDCRDMSAVVQLFTQILGGTSVKVLRIYYINCKPIWPIGKPETPNINWYYHQFGWYDNKVYDACIKIKGSVQYIPIGDDRDGNYKSNLRLSGNWIPESSQSITSFH